MSRRKVATMYDRILEEEGLSVGIVLIRHEGTRNPRRRTGKGGRIDNDSWPTGPKFVEECEALLPEMTEVFDEAYALMSDGLGADMEAHQRVLDGHISHETARSVGHKPFVADESAERKKK